MARSGSSILLMILTPFVLMIVLILTIFRAYWIPSGSMKPSLLVGDYVLANRASYGFPALSCRLGLCAGDMGPLGKTIARGDVATFRHPINGQHYVKRIIGLPGDRVQMRFGRLYLNGTQVPQTDQGTFSEIFRAGQGVIMCSNGPVADGKPCEKTQATEQLPNGVSYQVLNIRDDQSLDDTGEFIVPDGAVFVMGDNRDNSVDSRVMPERAGVGFVPLDHIIGRVDLIVFSLTGQRDRFFRWVR